ncbi:SDR family oxidoreductase [uncultured Methylovirgula sp.]|uniref:SDR family oxidoreductase n=1 Tax=uncultured Methylovirgula sp. TaxID=1285960 RepID=UPI0034588845
MPRKAALVTGAARRIGLAIAERLAGAGYDLAIHSSEATRPEAEAAAAHLRTQGCKAVVIAAELADPAEPERIIAAAHAALGPLSVLVNNASIFERDTAEAVDVALFDKLMAVNLRAPMLLAQHFAQQVPEGQEAGIVNLVDQRVWRPTPQFFSYSITKAGLWWATQTLAQALAPRRIRVNAVGPGPVLPNTPQGNAGFEKEVAGVLLQRAVAPAEIADAVLYLVEARNVTGQMIAVDAGQHLAWQTPDIPEI